MENGSAMRPFLAIIGLVLLCIALAYVSSTLRPHSAEVPQAERPEEKQSSAAGTTDPKNLLSYDKVTQGAVRATLEIEGKGKMTLELYPKAAPRTVEHLQE